MFSEDAWCLAPIAVWVHFHLRNPSTADRLSQYGFLFGTWRENPVTLLTHACVHISGEHLLSNILAYVVAIGGFVQNVRSQPSYLLGTNCGPVARRIREVLLATGIFFGSSILGGLPMLSLSNWLDRRRMKKKYGYSVALLEKMIQKVAQAGTNRVVVCGASAGIFGFSGYNAICSPSWINRIMAFIYILPELSAALQELAPGTFSRSDTSGTSPWTWFSIGTGGDDWTAPAGRVSHVAHVGGFLVGCAIGLAHTGWRYFASRRRNSATGRRLGTGTRRVVGDIRYAPQPPVQRIWTQEGEFTFSETGDSVP
jgi:membrane associated rhomboid family serine protease